MDRLLRALSFNPLFIGAHLLTATWSISKRKMEKFQSPLHRGTSSDLIPRSGKGNEGRFNPLFIGAHLLTSRWREADLPRRSRFNPLFIGAHLLTDAINSVPVMGLRFNPLFIGAHLLTLGPWEL